VLGQQGGMLGLIFHKAQNKIQDPAKLRQLIVELIGKESWLSMSADVKGDAYEGLLERNAQDVTLGTRARDHVRQQPPRAVADRARDLRVRHGVHRVGTGAGLEGND
jgi:hypothetical protein